jgi:hypothetical protein
MNMKRFITCLISLGAVLYFSGMSTYAQDKGPGHVQVPSVNQGHSQSTPTKTKSNEQSNHANTDNGHGPKAEDWQTKLNERFDDPNDAKFHARMVSLLPQGMDLKTAESGFKNRGQFIAALHVSKNLNIPFDQLKAKMTGVSVDATTGQTTNSTPMSLGKAIHELRPSIPEPQANQEAERAEKQAKETEKPGKPTT